MPDNIKDLKDHEIPRSSAGPEPTLENKFAQIALEAREARESIRQFKKSFLDTNDVFQAKQLGIDLTPPPEEVKMGENDFGEVKIEMGENEFVEEEAPIPQEDNTEDQLDIRIAEAEKSITDLVVTIDDAVQVDDEARYKIPVEVDVSETAFYPTKSAVKGKVDIAEGSWYMNGTRLTTDPDDTDELGTAVATNEYVVATITHGTANPLVPATITLTAESALADAADFPTKRNICEIVHDSDGNVTDIIRLHVGDIYQNLNAIQNTTWSDGATGGTDYRDVTTSERWDSTNFKYQVKKTRFTVKDGILYIGDEDSTWTDVFTADECP